MKSKVKGLPSDYRSVQSFLIHYHQRATSAQPVRSPIQSTNIRSIKQQVTLSKHLDDDVPQNQDRNSFYERENTASTFLPIDLKPISQIQDFQTA